MLHDYKDYDELKLHHPTGGWVNFGEKSGSIFDDN